MKAILTAAAAVLGLGGVTTTVVAQPAPAPALADPSAVAAGNYVTDPAHTLVQWSVSHFGFNPYWGSFGDVEGTLSIDPANIEATELDVTIPIESVSVVSEGLRDHLLRPGKDGAEPDFFGANPGVARFASDEVRRTGPTSALIHGRLQMLGTTQRVAVAVDFTGAGANPMSGKETIGFTGRARIKRSEFGIGYALPAISDEVDLMISAAFEKE